MPNGPRGGGGWSDEPPDRRVPRGRPTRGSGNRPSPYGGGFGGEPTWPGEGSRRGGRPRSAIHDPWGQRQFLPPQLPTIPTLVALTLVVILAFVLGRATAGGGGGGQDVATAGTTTSTILTTTTGLSLTEHVVAKGETLATIAADFGLTLNELAIANNIGDVNHVFIGQRLHIPAPTPTTLLTTPTTAKKKKGS